MFDITPVTHHIQKHILDVLTYQEVGRFRDLRPPRTDTNLFSYHLKHLLKSGLVIKSESGYSLGQAGLLYVDRVSQQKKAIRSQPKIVTMLVIQDSSGHVLLQKRDKQPYINAWTLPYGKLHIDDQSTAAAAQREAQEKLGIHQQALIAAGDCYIRVHTGTGILSTTLVHVFRFESDDISETDTLHWAKPHELGEYRLAPAVEQIVARTFFRDPFFFEEYNVEW